jgi:hypothetical protein
LNFSNEDTDFQLPRDVLVRRILISNLPEALPVPAGTVHLLAWQSVIFE